MEEDEKILKYKGKSTQVIRNRTVNVIKIDMEKCVTDILQMQT